MISPSRRDFIKSITNSLLVFSFFDIVQTQRAFAAVATPKVALWLRQANDLARCVKGREIAALDWQREMEGLLAHIDLPSLLKFIDFDTIESKANLPEQGEAFQSFAFAQDDQLPNRLEFYRNMAGFRKGTSIPPHAHDNLVSSFLVLKGELHGRHFDRSRDDGDEILVKPTIDRAFKIGQFSTVSDFKDNVHWFTATTDRSFIFDLGVSKIDLNWSTKGQTARWKADAKSGPNSKSGRVYLDIDRRISTEGDAFRVSRLTHEEAYHRYG
jgi:hypothetical protein